MANLMLDPNNWSDGNSDSPPSVWTGTLYDFTGFDANVCLIRATAATGDTVSFDLNNMTVSTVPDGLQVTINGDVVYSYDLHVIGTDSYNSPPLMAGDLVEIEANVQFVALYTVDFTLTAAEATIVAPDETISMSQGSPPVQVTPVITSGGDPVVPDSLALNSAASHGVAQVVGTALSYQPNSGFNGTDSFTYHATVGGEDSNVATVHVIVNPVLPCDELGRTTRTYVSGYTLSRANVARVRRMAKRCVVANFNGALPKGRSIVSVRWETTSPWAILMSNARIASNQRETMVDVTFNFSGWGGLLATATLDNGEVYNAEFSFTVLDTPLYPTATYPVSNGPYILTANS